MYRSLYKMHELALARLRQVTLDTLARLITRRTEPHVKLPALEEGRARRLRPTPAGGEVGPADSAAALLGGVELAVGGDQQPSAPPWRPVTVMPPMETVTSGLRRTGCAGAHPRTRRRIDSAISLAARCIRIGQDDGEFSPP